MSDSLSHHPHPSPPPLPPASSAATRVRLSAEQALSRVSGLDEQKRARYGHRHSNSVGAFSPSAATSSSQQQQKQISSPPSSSTASSSTSSLSFSSSSSASTSQHHLPEPVHSPFSTLTHTPPSPRPRTPRTPLRSSTTPQYPHAVNTSPRPSPLFQRLLEPFAKTVGALTSSPTTTTTPSATPTNLSFSFLLPPFNNQNNTDMYSPPSPTYMHQQYTASRSERLLRDALMRDEMERNTGTTASSSSSSSAISPHANAATSSASGSAVSSTSPRTHRRRHSHVPTSSTTPALTPNAHTSFASSGKLTASPTPLSPPLSTFSPSPNPNATAVAGPPSVAAATAGTHKDSKRRSLNTPSTSLTKQQEEDLTRGSFLFRTAMSNPRSMSPSGASSPSGSASAGSASGSRSREEEGTSRRSTSKSNESRVAYGGDREADVESLAVLPSTPLQRNGWRRQSVQATATAAGDEQKLLLQHDTMHSRSRSAYTGGTASGPRSTSHSPSPLRRQQRPSSLQRQQRPSPLPLSNNNNNNPNNGHSTPDHNTAGSNTPNSANLQRHHTIHSSPSYRRNAGAATTTTPEKTPSKRPTRAGSRPPPIDLYNHHQQLNSPRRAQRQQLQSSTSSYHQIQGLNPSSPGEPLIMTPHEQVLRARLERVLEAGKVVEKKEREKRRRSESRGATSGAAANEVRDEEGGWPWREKERRGRAGGVEVGDESPRMGHSRNRSKTDSALPSSSSSTSGLPPMPATPKRSTTAPAAPTTLSASKIPVLRRQQPRTGTTPPLEGGEDGDEDVEDGDLRLLTPPPTPPFTARIFGNGEYCPSPYKTSYSAGITSPARGTAKLGGLGGIRRPQNAPTVHNRQHQDMDDSHSSCSSSNSHSHGSQQHERRGRRHRSSSSASSSHENDLNTPPSPTLLSASAAAGHHRPQFNARKASARCRAIEGYVSFASVEGLGEPPADPLSPDDEDDEEGGNGRKRDGRGMLLSMGTWSGWTRRLLGVGATGTGAGTVQREGGGQGEGVVL